jgi:hypothetical protein
MAALGPSAVDDGTAILGAHADPKAMGAVTGSVARLESSFAHGIFLFVLQGKQHRVCCWLARWCGYWVRR